ncbi:MAG: hypothetical protein ACP5SI_06095 [Chloroflexia bacterium]
MRYRTSLGPFCPGWPGPLVVHLEVEDGIVHGAEVALVGAGVRSSAWEGLSIQQGLERIERLSAPLSCAYGLAFCQAVETIVGCEVPLRARVLRVLLAELERLASHLQTAGRILRAAGLPAEATTFDGWWQRVIRAREELTGRRYFPDLLCPGGLTRDLRDLGAVLVLVEQMKAPLYRLAHRVVSNRSFVTLLVGAGMLTRESAEEEGIGGPVARASEALVDLRCTQPYAAYAQLEPQLVTQGGGDAFARWMVFVLEAFESMRLLETIGRDPPGGPVSVPVTIPQGEAVSRVESPVGPLGVRVHVGGDGRLVSAWYTSPGYLLVHLLPRALVGQPVDWIVPIVASWGLGPGIVGEVVA